MATHHDYEYDYYAYSDYNETDPGNDTYNDYDRLDCPTSSLPFLHIYMPILYFLMFFAGFLGNLFVITVMCRKDRRGSRLVDMFVVNLALADLVFVLTLPLWAVSASQHGHWRFGDVSCKLSSYIITVNRFSNISFLTCMSVDRYLAVVRLMDSRFRSSRCVRLTCAAVWLMSLALGVPSLVYRGVSTSNGEAFCVEEEGSPLFLGLSLATVFITFALPVLVLVLCYGSVVARLRQHCVTTANPRAEARRRHSLKMVLTIILAFLVSWLPFNLFKTVVISCRLAGVDLSCRHQSVLSQGLILSCCLAFLNSCGNPALYFFLDHHFKRQAQKLWLTCAGKRALHQDHNSSGLFNGTSDSSGTTASRTRLQSLDQNLS